MVLCILQSLLVFYALEKIHLNDKTYAMVGSFTLWRT